MSRILLRMGTYPAWKVRINFEGRRECDTKFMFAKATMSSGTREITDYAPASMKSQFRPLRHFVSRDANPVSIYKPISKDPASRSIAAVNFAPGQKLYGRWRARRSRRQALDAAQKQIEG